MKEILCFGDSNTYGLIPGTMERYPLDVRWTGLLTEELAKEGYHIVEEGLCGRTTIFEDATRPYRKGSDLLPALLESHGHLDGVVLMLGTNDCKTYYGASPEKIGEGIRLLLDQIRAFSKDTKIILISPILLGERVWEEGFDTEFSKESVGVSKQLKKVYKDIAKEYGSTFLAASDIANPSERDQEHLDHKGHRALADAIKKILLEKFSPSFDCELENKMERYWDTKVCCVAP